MDSHQYTAWKDGDFYIGYLNNYPAYATQACSETELLEALWELKSDIESNTIPFVEFVAPLQGAKLPHEHS